MTVVCDNCGAAVELPAGATAGLPHLQQHSPNDPLIPFVKAQVDALTKQNTSLLAENEALSTKLVESTDSRTDLDEQLNTTQMELQKAQMELQSALKEIEAYREKDENYQDLVQMIANGLLIERKDVQPVIENLAYESQRRSQIESSKLQLESELEDLSRSLFEEANRMVNEERQNTHLAVKRVEALERQLEEVKDLHKSEHEQSVELKIRMGKLTDEKDSIQRERDALEHALGEMTTALNSSPNIGSGGATSLQQHIAVAAAARWNGSGAGGAPSTAGGSGSSGTMSLGAEASRKNFHQFLQHRSSASSVKSKSDSCYFSESDRHGGSHNLSDPFEERIPAMGFHLWDPVFIEFKSYMETLFSMPSAASAPPPSTGSLTSMYSFQIIPKATAQTSSLSGPQASVPIPVNSLLSNCRILKRMVAEDVEATLRFEPGNILSWTQRKRLMTAVTENTLVVEPFPIAVNSASAATSPTTAVPGSVVAGAARAAGLAPLTGAKPNCALCGNGISHSLYYQYRLTDTANESRTICPYCRTRLTSVCTFYSVVRMISKRIISSTTTPEKLYLEFLKIRLSMFLARCGVGVVTGDDSPRQQQQQSLSSQQQQHQLPKRELGNVKVLSQGRPLPHLPKGAMSPPLLAKHVDLGQLNPNVVVTVGGASSTPAVSQHSQPGSVGVTTSALRELVSSKDDL